MQEWAARVAAGLLLLCAADYATAQNANDAAHPIVPGFERFFVGPDADAESGGRLLLGELNCIACHRLDDANKQSVLPKQAPVLDQVGTRAAPQWMRDFLKDPQHAKPGTTMPNLLANLPASERENHVEALVHFLASTGSVAQTMPDRGAIERGDELFHTVGCVGCHGPQQDGTKSLPTGVPLGNLAAKYTVNSLFAFLRDPHAVRPSGRMPNLGLNEKEARNVANYLLKDIDIAPNLHIKYFEGDWQNVPEFASMKPKSTGKAAGFDLGVAARKNDFGLRFEGFLRIARDGDYTFHLGSDDGSRLTIDGRQVAINDGLHPFGFQSAKTQLTAGMHEVAVDYFQAGGDWELLVEYEGPQLPRQPVAGAVSLTKDAPHVETKQFAVDADLAARGRELFAKVGCASCHELKRNGKPIVSELAAKPLKELNPTAGCLAENPTGPSPDFKLSQPQRTAIGAVLKAPDAAPEPSAEQTIHHTLAAFNCYACHVRNKQGGVVEANNEFFRTTTPEMGDEGRIPPSLDGVGDKLTDDWFRSIFNNGANDRPYMLARMPKYGLANVGQLLPTFTKADRKAETERPTFELAEYRIKSEARSMVGEKALSCIKCHNFGQHQATGIQAADLTTMTRRLREDWFYRYMINPQVYRPGTRMPSAWPNGDSILPDVLGGDTGRQLAAIWLYLSDGSKAAVPAGIIRNPIELAPTDEPIIYRNFIQGLSPRGIAVGYPEKANLAFDADRFSLALIWHGAFIDASKHWVGRGPGFQVPLGDHVIPLVSGAPFAVLESADTTWPKEPPTELGYRFLGYRLDKDRRPTFRYGFAEVTVEDFPKPTPRQPDAAFVRRLTLAADKPVENLWFRAAAGKEIKALKDDWYQVDGSVRFRTAGAQPIVRQSDGRAELIVPVRFDGNRAQFVCEIVW